MVGRRREATNKALPRFYMLFTFRKNGTCRCIYFHWLSLGRRQRPAVHQGLLVGAKEWQGHGDGAASGPPAPLIRQNVQEIIHNWLSLGRPPHLRRVAQPRPLRKRLLPAMCPLSPQHASTMRSVVYFTSNIFTSCYFLHGCISVHRQECRRRRLSYDPIDTTMM